MSLVDPRRLSMTFAAGCVGGLVCTLALWFAGMIGIADQFKVNLRPALEKSLIYQQVVWGGIFGCVFAVPLLGRYHWIRTILISLVPTAVLLFLIFPVFENVGVMGTRLGKNTPYYVGVINLIWALTTGFWLRFTGED